MIVRMVKSLLVVLVGLLGLLSGLDNIVDYDTNFEVVRHVMSMDTTRSSNALLGRAVTSEALHRLFYAAIIGVELAYGAICVFGALRLFGACRERAAEFDAAKDIAIGGLALGFVLYLFGFLIVGGEWFQMWQSKDWNLQQAAFRFVGSIGIVMLFVALPEADRRDET